MDKDDLNTLKEATRNTFKRELGGLIIKVYSEVPQLCEGLSVSAPAAAELFNKIPHLRVDPGLRTIRPKASKQQVEAATVLATITHFAFSVLLESCVFTTFDKIAGQVNEILEAKTIIHQSEIAKLEATLKKESATDTPDQLPDMEIDTNREHQSTATIVAQSPEPCPPPLPNQSTSWSKALSKNQKKKLKKQAKLTEKQKFLEESKTTSSSTASPDSSLDRQKPLLHTPPISSAGSSSKRQQLSDDKVATLTSKKSKEGSHTGDNGLIITGYQPVGNESNLMLDLVVYDIPAKWDNYHLLSELNKWGKVISVSTRVQKKYLTARVRLIPNHDCLKAYNNNDWTVSLGPIPVRWFPAAWSLSERKQREKFQAAITNIPEDMTIESLVPNGISSQFLRDSNLQSFKIVKEQDGSRLLIGYFSTWDALSSRINKKQAWKGIELSWCRHYTPSPRSPIRSSKASGHSDKTSSNKRKTGSSRFVTGANRTPLGTRASNNKTNKAGNNNSPASPKKSARQFDNSNNGNGKPGNTQSGNINRVELKRLLEQLVSLCC